MSARRRAAPGGWAPPAPDPARRYARPRTRQLRTRDGRGCWIYRVACGCGWQRYEAGWRAALAAGDAHWHAEHRAAWRRPA